MSFIGGIFLFLGLVAALTLLCGLSVLLDRARRRRAGKIAALAADRGWAYESKEVLAGGRQLPFERDYSHFTTSSTQGPVRRTIRNTITGETELLGHRCPITAGDYERRIGSNRHGSSVRFSYLIVELPFTDSPSVHIRRETIIDRLGLADEDDMETGPDEFAKRFHVTASDEQFARDLLDESVRDLFLEADPGDVEIDRAKLCVAGFSRWRPDTFVEMLSFAERFVELWPEPARDTLRAHAEQHNP